MNSGEEHGAQEQAGGLNTKAIFLCLPYLSRQVSLAKIPGKNRPCRAETHLKAAGAILMPYTLSMPLLVTLTLHNVDAEFAARLSKYKVRPPPPPYITMYWFRNGGRKDMSVVYGRSNLLGSESKSRLLATIVRGLRLRKNIMRVIISIVGS
jgi:hypothetical protein